MDRLGELPTGYAQLTRDERLEVLSRELESRRPLFSHPVPLEGTTLKTFRVFSAMGGHHRPLRFGGLRDLHHLDDQGC